MELFDKTEEKQIYTVKELNEIIQKSVKRAFPEPVWVKGEVQRLNTRREHYYFELNDELNDVNYQIPVAAFQWNRRKHDLEKWFSGNSDFTIKETVEVCLQCNIDFYPPFGKLSLQMIGLDSSFTLGQMEARRREVYAYLRANGLLELQKQFVLPDLPLKIGLITSAGSAADNDFMAGLNDSGYPFKVFRADCLMMGQGMQKQMIRTLLQMEPFNFDIIVITRGGGSRGDLSWFDQQDLSETIAKLDTPVLTAIGHEIDTSIADAVAHTTCKTPTAAAEFIVDIVAVAEERIEQAAVELKDVVQDILQNSDDKTKELLQTIHPLIQSKMHDYEVKLVSSLTELVTGAKRLIAKRNHEVELIKQRIPAVVSKYILSRAELISHLEDKVNLLDPARLLTRGYSITTDSNGKVICDISKLKNGDTVRTRFRDGTAESVITEIEKR